MSEIISTTVGGIELTANEQANPVTPSWLGEVLLIGEYWRVTGLLDRLQTQVRVNRGRMGQYEVCDFVLLLLAYAVSGLDTLEEFFEQLKCVQSIVMSVWQRQHCPVASTLSRFLRDIDPSALEQLRTLFEADLFEHGSISMALIRLHGSALWPVLHPILTLAVAAKARPLKDISVGVEVRRRALAVQSLKPIPVDGWVPSVHLATGQPERICNAPVASLATISNSTNCYSLSHLSSQKG